MIDLAGTTALLAGMAASGLMTATIAFAMLAGYFLVAAESYLATHSRGTFRLSFAGFGPTELRIVLAIGAVKAAISPVVTIAGREVFLLDVGGAIATIGFGVAFTVSSIRNAVALFALEPLPTVRRPPEQTGIPARRRAAV